MYKKTLSRFFFFFSEKHHVGKAAETVSKQEIKYCTIIRIQQHYHVQEIRTKSTQLSWCNIHNQMCKLLTMHAMSASYKCIRLQHLQTLFAYTGILYIQCIYIFTNLASHIEIYPVMPPVLKETKSSVLSLVNWRKIKSCTWTMLCRLQINCSITYLKPYYLTLILISVKYCVKLPKS